MLMPGATPLVGEQVTLLIVVGAALVIAAVYIAALRRERPQEEIVRLPEVSEAPEPAPDPASGA
jgi:hypothetical protein